jgi:phosphoesterase RecJ-like protein
MPLDWSPFLDFIRVPQRFVLLTHIRPDGDALGSQLGMADLLEQLGKTVRVVIGSNLPDRYKFMDPTNRIERHLPSSDCFRTAEAIIVLDTGTWNQLGDCGGPMRAATVPKLVIDHHRTQDDLGAIRLVDVAAEATGRLVYQAFQAAGKHPTPAAASAMFVALAMDTGWFHHTSTSAETFALAAYLTAHGANPCTLFEQLYECNTLGRLRLQGKLLDRLELTCNGRVAISEIHSVDYPATESRPQDTEDFVQILRTLNGVELGLLFIEQPDRKVKVSFRSRPSVDVSALAEKFGGGGHKQASGATVNGTMAEARQQVLAAVNAVLTPH